MPETLYIRNAYDTNTYNFSFIPQDSRLKNLILMGYLSDEYFITLGGPNNIRILIDDE